MIVRMHFGNLETEWNILFELLLSNTNNSDQNEVLRNKPNYERKVRQSR